MASAPTGTVTFLFADIEGSTSLGKRSPIQRKDALARYDQILHRAVEGNGGHVFKTLDDTFCAAFATVQRVLEATVAAQRALFGEGWDERTKGRVRIALHTGVAQERDGDYFGPPVNQVARLLSIGHGGQVLVSAVTHGLAREASGTSQVEAEFRDLGEYRLKDSTHSERIYQLIVPDLASDFPPLKTLNIRSVERYGLKKLIGSGGMAEVYLAHDWELDRDVAFKRLRQQYAQDEEVVERFEREAKSAASLNHPNIAAVYDRGKTEDGSYYIVMELVSGGNLKERILKDGPLPASKTAELGLQVAQALRAAHEQGVIHRDIKPQNILLTESGQAKVTDFGIARAAAASTVTKSGFVLGTAHYLSPEQALGHPASPRSDLYSLGVVLYEMLTGELPHDAETQVGIVMKHVSGQLRPPKELDPQVPEELNGVVVRLMARDPEDRYQDAAELIKDLERVSPGESPAAVVTPLQETQENSAQRQISSQSTTPLQTAPPKARRGGERKGRRWIPIPLMLLLLALLGGAAYAFAPWGAAPETRVPDLVGADSIAEAQEMAGDNFEVLEGNRVESKEAIGAIVAQNPEAGEMAERGSGIAVDVSSTRIADVPDVEAETREDAERVLEEAGFDVEVSTEESSAENENIVMGQDPQGGGGETAEAGSVVTITVGEGPAIVEVPNIAGQTPEEAEQMLARANLTLGNQTKGPSDQVGAGQIVEQEPAADTKLKKGGLVDVVVSSGPEQLPVSEAEGENPDDATQTGNSAAPSTAAPSTAAPSTAAPSTAAPSLEAEGEDEDHGRGRGRGRGRGDD
jgi:beta-lactam-binding protein with PASTA domain/class 3 adenylate cyclase/tRNA A-37 threonylcarbamoyl transferase component Bud32